VSRFRTPALTALAALLCLGAATALAQDTAKPPEQPGATGSQADTFLLTVFLRHDESKTLDEIDEHLRQTGFYTSFPPSGVEVVSWYVMMGIGQVVTLRVPPDRLREVNQVLQQSAWGAFQTEFYPTYDYRALAERERRAAR
jgi:hypothetical protein